MASGSSSTSSANILQSKLHFPSFRDLSDENNVDFRYWEEDRYRGIMVQACTWCFLGEITYDESSQIPGPMSRNRVHVRDRQGEDDIPILFYPESGHFDFKTLKKGHTICVILAERHYFLDLTVGLRIEDLDSVKVIPCGLNDLFAMSSVHAECQNACWESGCGKKPISTAESGEETAAAELKRCARCHVARYCCKECQVKDWKERHRRWCKAFPEFLKLTKIDYGKCNKHELFGPFGRLW